MSTYIKGPVCGVANCPSRLWRIIDGRRTCQYGHVMEGDVEFNDEDEDAANAGVVTRRLNLTTNATGNFQSSFNSSQLASSQLQQRSKKIYGRDARLLFLKSLQFTLKRQTIWLINVQKFPKDFDCLVKIVWMSVLKSLDETAEMEDEDLSSLSTDPDRNQDLMQKKKSKNRLRLSLVSTLAILYMAAVHMGLPLYTCDLIKWASSGKLPYFKSNEKLPELWKMQLPNYFLGILEGGKGPHEGQVFIHVAKLCDKTDFSNNFNNIVMCEGMLLKLVIMATLPPKFFLFTAKLISATSKDGDFELSSSEKPQHWAELKIIAYFLLGVKWLILYDDKEYPLKWISAISQRQKRDEVSQDTIDRDIKKLSNITGTQDIFDWTDNETDQYLEWVENAFLPIQSGDEKLKIDHRIAKRKLHKLFPLESETFTGSSQDKHRLLFVEELQEKYLFFQASYESADDIEYTEDERLLAAVTLENILLEEIAIEYAVSIDQLKTAVKNILQQCLIQLKN